MSFAYLVDDLFKLGADLGRVGFEAAVCVTETERGDLGVIPHSNHVVWAEADSRATYISVGGILGFTRFERRA
jgi:hypothetical protein